jgi:uncharacterized protein (DUF697 family)
MTTAIPQTTDVTEVPATPEGRAVTANAIIKHYAYWSVGAGLVPIPIIDLIGVGGVQLKMISKLSELYGVPFSEHAATNIIGALVGTAGGSFVARSVMASIVKTVPGAGALVGAIIAGPAVAGAATYAVGKVFLHHFETGGTLLDLNPAKMRAYYRSQFQEGQKIVVEPKKTAK